MTRRPVAEPRAGVPRESGRFQRRIPREALCCCGAAYDVDVWLALPLLGQIRHYDDDDDGPLLAQATISVRLCPTCNVRLVSWIQS